ncbi:MAG: glycoside hydrolase family 127 protein [Armatimonadota bacterium]|nr:glycoside hydrolase family 127 protein [Armatimonadota bacterium]
MVTHDAGWRAASAFTPVRARPPLAPAPFVALPLGSVRARGWLLDQLEAQRTGLTGHAEEVLPATASNSAWKGGNGEDWEKGPYYLKGLVALAYTLDDATLKSRAQAWIEPILASQRDDGFFGPKKNNDWWPRMVATYLLRDYAEATGDARVVPFLSRYYRSMLASLPARPLRDWGRARAGDEIDTVLWLYNRTGDDFLLALADVLAAQAYPWRQIFTENRFLEYGDDFHPKHNVNVPQALKMPVVYSQRSGKTEDKAAYRAGITHLMRDHGTAFGISTGTEMLAGRSAAEGVELCSIAEYLLSAETALLILADARIGDELELVAFNALPAALSRNLHQHVYYTLSNNVTAPRGELGYEQNYADARTPAPRSGYPCCCYNLHMGWPKLAQNAWAATSDGGLAALTYVPSQVSASLADGQSVSVICDTDYPFEETIRLTVRLEKAAPFPLQLRVPGWCQKPQIKVNGRRVPGVRGGTFAVINRVWQDGDRIDLKFPMNVEVVRGVNDSVSVRRGPLVYVLGLSEKWRALEQHKIPSFESYEVTSDSPWNFALVLNEHNPAKSFKVIKKAKAQHPFDTGQSPVALRVRGQRVEQWKLRFDGRNALDPPVSPVASKSPVQTLELVPFGSQMLRVCNFPVIGTPFAPMPTWHEDFAGDYSQRWVVYRGSFVRDHQMHLPHAAKAFAPRAVFADVIYEADVVVGDKGNAGVVFRASEPSIGTDHYLGYYAGISAEKNQVILGKSNNKWIEIGTKSKTIQAGRAHRVRVEAHGAQIRVWVDDMETPVLEAMDESFAAGALGVRSYSNKAAFGNLSARAI